jgi:hypothetical protein
MKRFVRTWACSFAWVAVTVDINHMACMRMHRRDINRHPSAWRGCLVARRVAAGPRSPAQRSVAAMLSDRHSLSLTVRASDGWLSVFLIPRGSFAALSCVTPD